MKLSKWEVSCYVCVSNLGFADSSTIMNLNTKISVATWNAHCPMKKALGNQVFCFLRSPDPARKTLKLNTFASELIQNNVGNSCVSLGSLQNEAFQMGGQLLCLYFKPCVCRFPHNHELEHQDFSRIENENAKQVPVQTQPEKGSFFLSLCKVLVLWRLELT